MTKFDEREAIRNEMDFIKEQSHEDFRLYFELRKERSRRFTELQERLRELDSIEYERENKPKQVIKEQPIKERFSDLPKERQIVDYLEKQPKKSNKTLFDYVEKQPKQRKGIVYKSTELVNQTISNYLKQQKEPATIKQIKEMIIQELNKEYANMTDVLKNAEKSDSKIIKHKEGHKVFYTYQNN
jgi:hypothetical protein